jgi:hypothetical protein
MAINVEINKTGSENNMSILRRFRKRVQGSGVIPRLRSIRYEKRSVSDFNKKKSKLVSLKRAEEREKLYKLGKLPENKWSRKGGR